MAEVGWSTEALEQLKLITEYIAQFNPAAAQRNRDRLLALSESLSDFPNRGRPAAFDTREMVTVRPYVLRYQVEGETVTILGVRHAAQLSPD